MSVAAAACAQPPCTSSHTHTAPVLSLTPASNSHKHTTHTSASNCHRQTRPPSTPHTPIQARAAGTRHTSHASCSVNNTKGILQDSLPHSATPHSCCQRSRPRHSRCSSRTTATSAARLSTYSHAHTCSRPRHTARQQQASSLTTTKRSGQAAARISTHSLAPQQTKPPQQGAESRGLLRRPSQQAHSQQRRLML